VEKANTNPIEYEYVEINGVPTDVGDYKVKAVLVAGNYGATLEDAFTISQKEIGITWGSASFTYNGTSHVPTATATGLVNNDAISITVDGAQTDASASSFTATATGLTGTKADNYKLPAANTKAFTIAPKSINASITAENKPYDGTTAVNLIITADTGVTGETISNITGVSGAFEDANAGSNKTVTITANNVGFTVTGGQAKSANYTLNIPESVTANIIKDNLIPQN
jgi:hypothetical protein